MASEKRSKKPQLADCTNTPHLSRPRRSCCSYASPSTTKLNSTIQSPQPNNPLIDPNYPVTGSNDNQNQNEGYLRFKSSFPASSTFLLGVRTYETPQCAQDSGQNNGVYSKRGEREGTSLQVTSSCPPPGRGSLKSKQKTVKSLEPENRSKDIEDLLGEGEGSHDENKNSLRVDINGKENLITPETVSPALYNFHYLDSHEDINRRNARVYSKRRQRECGSSEEVSSSCPRLGRAVIESKQKTGRFYEAKNCLKNLEDFSTPASNNNDQNELSLNGKNICKENLSTPQPCAVAIDNFQFPDDNVDGNLKNIRVQTRVQGSNLRSFEKVSLSCPPLGRVARKSPTGERCTEVLKNSSLGAWDDSPVSGMPKMKAQRRRKSLPVNERKHTLPENFIQEQRAHFAEVDAFALEEEEEDSPDADYLEYNLLRGIN